MNKCINKLLAILIPSLLLGCVKEAEQQTPQEELYEVVFHAGWAPETKTVLQGDGSVWWSPGDEISLFVDKGGMINGGYKLASTNTEPISKTNFIGKIGNRNPDNPYIAIYPYSEANNVNGNVVSAEIPSVQIAKENTFEKDMFVSIAISNDENLSFKNICSGVKFSVKTSGIQKVVISSLPGGRGAGLTGSIWNPDFFSDPDGFNAGNGMSVTIMAPSGAGFEPGKYYYAVLAPANCGNGVDVSYYKGDEMATFRYEKPIKFKRGVFKKLFNKDEGLNYRKASNSYAEIDYYNILPENVDKRTITEAYFHTSSNKQTEIQVGNFKDIYFEMIGSVAHYYTPAESYSVDGYQLFYGWNALKKLDISGFDTFNSTSFKEMFAGCMSLETLDLRNFSTDNVTNMSMMFASCASLQSLDLSNFNTEKVTDMSGMFGRSWDGNDGYSNYHYCVSKGCSSLQSLDLRSFNTTNLTGIVGMFAGCTNLKEVDLSTWQTSKIKSLSGLFYDCIALKNVDLSSFDTQNVIYLSEMFYGCKNLESIDLSKFKTSNVESMAEMFMLCQSLKDINLSGFTSEALTDIRDMFCGCSNLLRVDLGKMDLSSYDNLYSAFWLGTAKSSRACAIRCIMKTKTAIENASLGRPSYFIWVKPNEDYPEVSPYRDPSLYYSSDFSLDGNFVLLNKATEGKGVDIVLIGDAYSDRLIKDGTYENDMRESMEIIFSIEPYKSFRNLFNVYMVYAVSENEVADGNTALGSYMMVGNSEIINSYALSAVTNKYLPDIAIVIIGHDPDCLSGTGSGGTTWHFFSAWNPNGYPTVDYGQAQQTISLIPKYTDSDGHNFAWVLNHEFGHCFAKLADEYYDSGSILTAEEKEFLEYHTKATGIFRNIDITNDIEKIKWKKFLKDDRYNNSGIGIFEGGDLFETGIWRPSMQSIMNNGLNSTNYFNAPSREAIYNRIHKLAYSDGWQFDYETFVDWDAPNREADIERIKGSSIQTKSVVANPVKPHLEIKKNISEDGKVNYIIVMD